MASPALGHLPSLWRQHLLSEFAGLKQACPEGVFVSLTPGDPSLWSAVLFVRNGPYAPAVLRFQISFPDAYPRAPPLVTFSTDIFHPLVTPLTTHMCGSDIQDDGNGERERLSPGGFSLRHGFPEWFQRERRAAHGGRRPSKINSPASSTSPAKPLPRYMQTTKRTVSTYSLLRYIRSTFDKAQVLDSVPPSAAGNSGAWHAWQTHRRKQGNVPEGRPRGRDQPAEKHGGQAAGDDDASDTKKSISSQAAAARRPGEWNWDGVWEDRVRKGVAYSLSEPVLYGSLGAPDNLIHFLALEEGDIEAVKGNLRRTLDLDAAA